MYLGTHTLELFDDEDDVVDRVMQCLDKFAQSVASTKRKDFLTQLLKPNSLSWLWRRVSTSGNNEDCSHYLDDILRRKTRVRVRFEIRSSQVV